MGYFECCKYFCAATFNCQHHKYMHIHTYEHVASEVARKYSFISTSTRVQNSGLTLLRICMQTAMNSNINWTAHMCRRDRQQLETAPSGNRILHCRHSTCNIQISIGSGIELAVSMQTCVCLAFNCLTAFDLLQRKSFAGRGLLPHCISPLSTCTFSLISMLP